MWIDGTHRSYYAAVHSTVLSSDSSASKNCLKLYKMVFFTLLFVYKNCGRSLIHLTKFINVLLKVWVHVSKMPNITILKLKSDGHPSSVSVNWNSEQYSLKFLKTEWGLCCDTLIFTSVLFRLFLLYTQWCHSQLYLTLRLLITEKMQRHFNIVADSGNFYFFNDVT